VRPWLRWLRWRRTPDAADEQGVQEEIKADKDQVAKIDEVARKFRETTRPTTTAEPRTRAARIAEINRKLNEKFNTVAKDLVGPEHKRVKQIQLQQQGIRPTRPRSQKALKITDEQKEKIKTIGDDLRRTDPGTGGNIQERFTKIREMTKEAGEKSEAHRRAEDLEGAHRRAVQHPLEQPPSRRRPPAHPPGGASA
jgi:hypothetical protein